MNSPRARAERRSMNQATYELDLNSRTTVLQTLPVSRRDWDLLAAHVRTNHIHVIVEAEVPSENVMNDFKIRMHEPLAVVLRDPP
jgi:hypothetical protein